MNTHQPWNTVSCPFLRAMEETTGKLCDVQQSLVISPHSFDHGQIGPRHIRCGMYVAHSTWHQLDLSNAPRHQMAPINRPAVGQVPHGPPVPNRFPEKSQTKTPQTRCRNRHCINGHCPTVTTSRRSPFRILLSMHLNPQ
jgi:hypothetical protein